MKKFLGFLNQKPNRYGYEEEWDENDDLEYQADLEEYDEEYYKDESDGTYYADEYVEECYEDECYTDEYVENGYEDDYYADDDPYYVENYEGEYDEEYYQDEDIDYMDEEEDWQEPLAVNFFEKVCGVFSCMDRVDRIVACTGLAVLILALVTGTVFVSSRFSTKQVNTFATVGSQLDGIEVIGGEGLMAVADAQIARQEAAAVVEEETEQEEEGYEEEEYSHEVTVSLNMTSIKKDLKIKFVNKKTGKLIPNVPFEITVTNPKGKTDTWVDDDKDGIIYKTEIASGEYAIALNPLTDYKDYKISTDIKKVKVKENLDYEKVDVSDEIKTEAEIDASKEDTAKNDIVEESKLQDTVTWVESTKTAVEEGYVEISKSTIDEPKVVRFDNFMKLAGTNGETVSILGGGNVAAAGEVKLSASAKGFEGKVKYVWSVDSCPKGVTATLSNENSRNATLKVKNTTAKSQTITISVSASSQGETVSGGETPVTYSDSATTQIVVAAGNAVSINLDKTSGTVLAAKTFEIVPTITGNDIAANKITWTTSDANIATVSGDNKKATVTGVKAGDVTITASYTENDTTVTATCAIKVQANPAADTTTALKDKNGNQVYVLNAQGQYVPATYADYFKENQKFYLRQHGYKYTGWQTIDGNVYFFDVNGNKVTGAQVIQGAQYSFDSNGIMVSSNGILGIDVSKWNGSIDWNAVKNSGVSYVIIRCGYRGSSQGSLIEDPKYRANIQGATAAGLKVGVYFFSQAINEIEAVEEASMVLSLVKGYNLSYPIFLDVEASGGRADNISKETRTAVCVAFCQTIKNSGYASGVYANKTWFTSYIDTSKLGAYRIWLAQYAAEPTYSGRYDIWQYSSKGKVGGIGGDVDMNLSYMGY